MQNRSTQGNSPVNNGTARAAPRLDDLHSRLPFFAVSQYSHFLHSLNYSRGAHRPFASGKMRKQMGDETRTRSMRMFREMLR
jgi:hypothetical protein